MSGFGQNLLERNTGIQCDAARIFILRRETFGARFDSNISPWRDHFPGLAWLHAAFGDVETHAQSGGFGEEQGNELLAIFRVAEDLQHHTRAILLHLGGDDDDIERARCEQALGGKADDLGRGIVDVGIDDRDGDGLGGTTGLATRTRNTLACSVKL